jgi:uncharacterized protein (DUF983 family)
MGRGDGAHPPAKLSRHLWRALRLRCPECGVSPLFLRLRRVRNLGDWLTPLDGCPCCNYRYEREPGYFLPAIWYIHYSVVAAVGLGGGLIADGMFHAGLVAELLWALIPAVIVAIAVIRWSKAMFLAIDHFIDPQKGCPIGSFDEIDQF